MRKVFVPVLVSILSGCASGSVFHEFQLDPNGGNSYTTSADQRLISSMSYGVATAPGRVHPQRIVCVEPSPDVAMTVANQIGAGVSAFGYGSGSLSASTAQGIAQLAERTTAIQALLKQGYQACLDYANGAITGTSYSQRTSRLDDLMVTLILSENASGAFGRSGAALAGKASGSAQASLSQLDKDASDVQKLQEKLATAEKSVTDKEAEVETAEQAAASAPEAEKEAKNAIVSAKQAELGKAKAERWAILAQLKQSADSLVTSSAEITTATGIGGITANPNAEIAKVLGEMQARFLDKDIDQSYIATCLTELGHRKLATAEDNEYRKLALAELTKIHDKAANGLTFGDGGFPGTDYGLHLESFFLSTQLTGENQLTQHCRQNLSGFVETSIRNRQELKLKRLEIEQAKLTLLAKQAEQATPKAFHPKLVMARLQADKAAYDKVKNAYDTMIVKVPKEPKPDPNKVLRDEFKAFVKGLPAFEKEMNAAVAAGPVGEVAKLEAAYLTLVADIRQEGTTLQRKAWKADYDKQQAEAESRTVGLTKVSKKVRGMTAALKDLHDRIVKTFDIK
ncbi:hypothetical protein L2D14_10415 [Thalassospiraceae bacterium LMO-JJ14]|nr:hypothetical protein L2D14_10415 [Thalassospiraceae bacterium LMO-JJ14]